MIRVGVIGASGYVGAEVVRWVLHHPALELAAVVSSTRAGQPISEALPGLLGVCDLAFEAFDAPRLGALDVLFLAVPHGKAAPLVEALGPCAATIIDCSADHRHAGGWVYGQPEWSAERLVGARRIAAPGCFASAMALGLAPYVHAGLVEGPVTSVGATGSTGSGASPVQGTHHPERFANLKAYKVLQHQHVPEVQGFLGGLGASPSIAFVPLSAPLDRGILVTSFFQCTADVDPTAVLRDAYADKPGIRVRTGSPELRFVRGTGFCDIAAFRQGDIVSVISAIDNLGRGAGTQAVQAFLVSAGQDVTPLFLNAPLVP